jgi:hypothetical protein
VEKIFSKERHSGAASGGAWSENFMRVRVQQLVDEVVILVLKLRAVVCVYMVDEACHSYSQVARSSFQQISQNLSALQTYK